MIISNTSSKPEVVLNDEQKAGHKAMLEFLRSSDKEKMFLLKGYAGTGKTFLISHTIEEFCTVENRRRYAEHAQLDFSSNYQPVHVAMTAPTNEAVQVLRESSRVSGAKFKTIHSLLGLKETITESGQIEFTKSFEDDNIVRNYDIIIIDEVSMLNDDLFFEIKRYRNKIKIIMMGDPAQVPPIGKRDCEPFLNPEEHGIYEIQLTQIMRQANGSAIIQNGMNIRENLNDEVVQLTSGHDVDKWSANHSRPVIRADFMATYTSASVADTTKVIAWTNKQVLAYNQYIRNILFGMNAPFVVDGERLIICAPIKSDFDDSDVENEDTPFERLTVNQKITVTSHEIKKVEAIGGKFFVYVASIEFLSSAGTMRGRLKILHDSERERFNQIATSIKREATNALPENRKQKWAYYWKFMRQFANVRHAYALTVHKAQGRTYDKTFIDVNDICRNSNVYERNRILYTAITRARNKVVLIT